MKTKLLSATLTLLLIAAFVGCGQTKETIPPAESSLSEGSEETAPNVETTEGSSEEGAQSAMKTEYPLTVSVYNVEGELVEQTFTKAPERAIPYTASAVVTMLELGLEDKIIGIMEPDNAPPEKWEEAYTRLNAIGDKMSVSRETIIALEPDFVFGRTMSLADDIYGTVESFNEMDINVYSQKASSFAIDQSMDNIIEDILNMGKIFDVQERAEEYAKTLTTKLNTITSSEKLTAGEDPLNVVIMVRYDNGTFSAFGSNSTLQNEALRLINMENVVEGTAGQLTDENLVAINPDVIVYITAGRNAEFDAVAREAVLSNPILSDIPAIQNEIFIEVPYETMMDYGPGIFDGIEMIYNGVYSE